MPGPNRPNRGPATPFEWWFSIGFLAFVLVCFAGIVFVDYEPRKSVILFILASWLLLLPWHEAGHALAARWLGWRVGQVVIGWGRPMLSFRWGDAEVQVCTLPLEGFVRTVPTNLRWPRLKSALIYFAGPGAELLLLGIVALAIGPDTLLDSQAQSHGVIAAQGFGATVLASAFLNLLPHGIQTENGFIPNDGLGIIQSFFVPERHFADMIGQTFDTEQDAWEPYDPADWWKRGEGR